MKPDWPAIAREIAEYVHGRGPEPRGAAAIAWRVAACESAAIPPRFVDDAARMRFPPWFFARLAGVVIGAAPAPPGLDDVDGWRVDLRSVIDRLAGELEGIGEPPDRAERRAGAVVLNLCRACALETRLRY